jgi:gas vesicle protein
MNKFLFGLFCGAIITGAIAYLLTKQNAEKETD